MAKAANVNATQPVSNAAKPRLRKRLLNFNPQAGRTGENLGVIRWGSGIRRFPPQTKIFEKYIDNITADAAQGHSHRAIKPASPRTRRRSFPIRAPEIKSQTESAGCPHTWL